MLGVDGEQCNSLLRPFYEVPKEVEFSWMSSILRRVTGFEALYTLLKPRTGCERHTKTHSMYWRDPDKGVRHLTSMIDGERFP